VADTTWGGLLDGLQRTFQSPLFLSGAAMVDAGARGQNVGAGLLAGADAAQKAAHMQAEQEKQRREMLNQQAQEEMWRDIAKGGTPAWAAHLPPGTLDLARTMGPAAGQSFISEMMKKNAERQIERDKLDSQNRHYAVQEMMLRQQMAETAAMNADRRDSMNTTREFNNFRLQQERESAERRRRIVEGDDMTPPPAQPPAAAGQPGSQPGRPPQQPVPPQTAPRPRQMSAPVEDPQQGDPNLIRTQATLPPPPGTQPPAPQPAPASLPPGMVQTPRGPMPAPQARALGQRMLVDPELRPLGQDIIKQADAIEGQGGLDKTAKGETEKSMVSDIHHLARLNDIERSYQKEFLEIKPRLRAALNANRELIGSKLNPEEREQLEKLTTFRKQVISNFNLLLKEASGAAVTEQEFNRMKLQEPNAEWTGMFGRWDSPTEFESKLASGKRLLIASIARKNWLRTQLNLTPEQIGEMAKGDMMPIRLDEMPATMKRWEQQRMLEIRRANPRAGDDEVQRQTAIDRHKVFGI